MSTHVSPPVRSIESTGIGSTLPAAVVLNDMAVKVVQCATCPVVQQHTGGNIASNKTTEERKQLQRITSPRRHHTAERTHEFVKRNKFIALHAMLLLVLHNQPPE
jgi:hypothetical protein